MKRRAGSGRAAWEAETANTEHCKPSRKPLQLMCGNERHPYLLGTSAGWGVSP